MSAAFFSGCMIYILRQMKKILVELMDRPIDGLPHFITQYIGWNAVLVDESIFFFLKGTRR